MLPTAPSWTGWSEQPPAEVPALAVFLWPCQVRAACPIGLLCKQCRLASRGFCCSIPVPWGTWAVAITGAFWWPPLFRTWAITNPFHPGPCGSSGGAGCAGTGVSQQDSVLGMAMPPGCRKLCKTSLTPPTTLVTTRENPQLSSAHSAQGKAELATAQEHDTSEASVPSAPRTVRWSRVTAHSSPWLPAHPSTSPQNTHRDHSPLDPVAAAGSIMPRRLQPPSWHDSIAGHGTELAVKEDPRVEGNPVRDSRKSDKSPWGKPQGSA